MAKRTFSNGVIVEDVQNGLLVSQAGEAYVARNWRLTPAVEHLIETAFAAGLSCMIREDHPRRNARWPNDRGVVYLAFSPNTDGQWSLAIDTFRPGAGDFGFGVFNGKYQTQFNAAELPFVFEGRNKGAGHLVVARDHVIPTLKALAAFDHSVLGLNRTPHQGEGFTTEYGIQRQILTNWRRTPWATRYDVLQDEFPVDRGLTSRRIDILARDRVTGDWLVIELKRAEAHPSAVQQVEGYLVALGRRDEFAHGRLDGVLVAERLPQDVREKAQSAGIAGYEIAWPVNLTRTA
ncbi:MAG: endonuclease NucS [Gemmobacter sp.]|nr:endonuclease NucS [Gemmobacter sp.]